jgi:hypothetical protein
MINRFDIQQGGDLNVGRRSFLDRWRSSKLTSAGIDQCATVYNQNIEAPLQQQTLIKPLAFQNICAPQSMVPDVKTKVSCSGKTSKTTFSPTSTKGDSLPSL